MPNSSVLPMHNGLPNGMVHMYPNKQLHADVDAIVSFIINT